MNQTRMRSVLTLFLCIGTLLLFPGGPKASAAEKLSISGFIGTSSSSAAANTNVVLYSKEKGQAVDNVQTNFLGKYKFQDVAPGTYLIRVGKVEREVVMGKKNLRVDIDLSTESGVMDYTKTAKTAGGAQPAGPSDSTLMQWMAAEFYSFTGSTERKMMLCPDGRFFRSSESGYSGVLKDGGGTQTGAWGTANQSSGSGRWSVQGSQQQGIIVLSANDGSRNQLQYQATGEKGCFTFNGVKHCVSGAARCQ